MPDVKIKDLPLAAAVGASVVPVMNTAGTATNSVTLASIAALGGGIPAAHAASHGSAGADPISPSSIGAAAADHAHGGISADGKVGSTSGLPLVTGAGGSVTVGAFGTTSGTFCQGDDARITGSRTPTAHAASHATGGSDAITYSAIGAAAAEHAHGNITNAGAIGTTSGLPVVTTTSGVLTTGAFGNTGGTICQGNDSRLSDSRTPASHAASHPTCPLHTAETGRSSDNLTRSTRSMWPSNQRGSFTTRSSPCTTTESAPRRWCDCCCEQMMCTSMVPPVAAAWVCVCCRRTRARA